MGIHARQVKNKRDREGNLTYRQGTVYDVNIKYKTNAGIKSYSKKGFLTRGEAQKHEAEMRNKLSRPNYNLEAARKGKEFLSDYLSSWLEKYAKVSCRPNTYYGYRVNINNHVIPSIGSLPLNCVSASILDELYRNLLKAGYSGNTVKYVHRTLSVALEHARRYQYIESNPAKSILTKFNTDVKTPDPYTIEQMQSLLAGITDPQWKLIVVLGGLYGLRRNEVLGLKWADVDLRNMTLNIVEQLASKEHFDKPKSLTAELKEKYSVRTLPITNETNCYFDHQLQRYNQIKHHEGFVDYGFVICQDDGQPLPCTHISRDFGKLTDTLGLPHIRFHDLRHTAATNMHQLTGDFYTVGEILGHSLKGIGHQLGISGGLEAVTERYVDVRLERKKIVLDKYHTAINKSKDNGPER